MTGLFSLSRKKILPIWSYTADGIIWRLLVSPDGYLLGEDRQKEAKTVSFFCIHLGSGDPLWQGLKFEQEWWIGLEAIHKDVVFFHEYATPDLPEHKKIYAVDMMTGRVLWENDQNQYLFVTGESVYTARDTFDRRILSEIDLHSGHLLREVDQETISGLRSQLGEPEQTVEFPSILEKTEPANEPLWRIVESLAAEKSRIVHAECLEKDGSYILSYYEDTGTVKNEVSLEQHLVVFWKERQKIIFRDLLNTGAKVAVPDAFFGKGNTIYYIKGKRILQAVAVPLPG